MTRAARLPTARQAELAAAIAPAPESAALRSARKQKAAIEAYWRERGRAVDIELVPIRLQTGRCDASTGERFYALASNTLNGQPIGGAT